MEKKDIEAKIEFSQNWLLDKSEKIKKCLIECKKGQNLSSWICHILKEEEEILSYFHIPCDDETRSAVLNLLNNDSAYREPIMSLLVTRIMSYTSSTLDLKNYTEKNEILLKIGSNLSHLMKLTKAFKVDHFENKTVEKVSDSLIAKGLNDYKTYFKEPDIRVVLKTIQVEENTKILTESLVKLLDFLYEKIRSNTDRHGIIAESRHAWWAYKDQIAYRDKQWLEEHKYELTMILENLLKYGIYCPKNEGYRINIQETSIEYYERVWVIENAIKIYEENIDKKFITKSVLIKKLKDFIIVNIKEHLNFKDKVDTLRNYQCDLILLYEVLEKYDILYDKKDVLLSGEANDNYLNNNLSADEVFNDIIYGNGDEQ